MWSNSVNYQDQGEQMGYGVYQYAAEVPYFPPSADYVGFNADDDGGKPDNIYEADEELHNNEAFQKNKMNVNLLQQQKQSPQLLMTPQMTPRPAQKLNDRAAELKAQLLKKREERTGSVPPAVIRGLRAKSTQPGIQSARQSPGKSPATPDDPSMPTVVQSLTDMMDLEELLSEGKAMADAKIVIKRENTNGEDTPNELSVRAEQLSSAPFQNLQRQEINTPQRTGAEPLNNITNQTLGKVSRTRHQSDEPTSEVSDGEIREESKTRKPLPPTGPKEPELTVVKRKIADTQRKTHEKPHIPHDGHEDRASRNNRDFSTHHHNSSRDQKLEPRSYGTSKNWKSNEKLEAEYEQQHQKHNDAIINGSKHGSSNGAKNDVKTLVKTPTLAELLAVDDDLREWLEITNWNDVEYRAKKLKNHRALAKVEAERKRILEEMAAEEPRGVVRTSTNAPVKSTDTPAELSVQPPATLNTTSSKAPESTRASRLDRYDSDNHTLKRRYSDATSAYDEHEEKSRYNSQGRKIRIKNEDEHTASISTLPNHSSVDSRYSRYEERGHERGRSRDYDHELDISPGRRAYESRPPPRTDFPSIESNAERGDWHDFASRGNYRGNRFDPKFNERGRGRGRGRGGKGVHGGRDYDDDLRSPEIYREPHHSSGRLSGSKWDKGGKGDTRYFMVKSFNEAMVLECQRDGIWTTQKHNGDMLTEAFQKCKNVILCFSINKSKAFQGYARMEGLPGSVEPPHWQKQIHWETTGAFPVRWFNTGRTGFYIVGNVMNMYNRHEVTNEVLSVIVGRDGQEIEGSAGAQLVDLMDEEEERVRRGEPGLGRDGASSGKRYRDPNEEVGAIRNFKSGNYARGGFGA